MQYDGACFHGWQVQQNAYTVQQALQDALQRLFGERPDVKGCSRTDSGVHAQAYCATFRTQKQIACENILRALNTYLPRGICVFDCFEVLDDFHPRYSCLAKQYVYKIYNAPVRSPFYENRALHYPYRLDETFLDREAKAFLGGTISAAFAARAAMWKTRCARFTAPMWCAGAMRCILS